VLARSYLIKYERVSTLELAWRINLLNSLILHFFIRKIMIELSCKHEVTAADDGGCHKAYDPVSDLTGDVSYLFSMEKFIGHERR
jgi:hypothetical protein